MRILALVVTLLTLVGCAPALPPVTLSPAPRALADLTIYVEDEAPLAGDMAEEHRSLATSIPSGVSGALTRAGLLVVTDKSRPHDAVVKLTADVTYVPSIFIVQVNGKVLKDSVAKVRLGVEADGVRIDEVEATTPGGNPTKPEAIDRVVVELVNGLTRSMRLARLAEKKPHGAVAQAPEPKGKAQPSNPGPGPVDPLIVINVDGSTSPSVGKPGTPTPANPGTASAAEDPSRTRPKAGTAAAANTVKPKTSSQPVVSPQTTSR